MAFAPLLWLDTLFLSNLIHIHGSKISIHWWFFSSSFYQLLHGWYTHWFHRISNLRYPKLNTPFHSQKMTLLFWLMKQQSTESESWKESHHVPLPRPPSFLINMTDMFLTGHPESVITLSPTLHSPSLWNQTLQKPPKSTGWSLNSRVEYTNLVFWEFLLLSAFKKLYFTYLGLLTAFIFLLYSYAFYSFDNVEKAMAPHFSALAWKIPWMEEPGNLQSMGSLRVGHDWATWLSIFTFMHWRRKWQPTPEFLAGESQGRRSPVGCHLWGLITDTSEAT